jgi:hypothetical protein
MDHPRSVGFAPSDPFDGRKQGDWQTRYADPMARKAIRLEVACVSVTFFACPVLLLLVWLVPKRLPSTSLGHIVDAGSVYAYAWLGGLFGGNLFSMKWLYHSVAHSIWNRDRRLWRLMAPHASAGIAFVFVCIVRSRLFVVFNPDALNDPAATVGFSFLVGYFSDTALAKLADIAYSLFGPVPDEWGSRPGLRGVSVLQWLRRLLGPKDE